jgi:hypothetical protein
MGMSTRKWEARCQKKQDLLQKDRKADHLPVRLDEAEADRWLTDRVVKRVAAVLVELDEARGHVAKGGKGWKRAALEAIKYARAISREVGLVKPCLVVKGTQSPRGWPETPPGTTFSGTTRRGAASSVARPMGGGGTGSARLCKPPPPPLP